MNLTRRSFLHASLMAGGLVAVPQFGRWFRPPVKRIVAPYCLVEWCGPDGVWREYGKGHIATDHGDGSYSLNLGGPHLPGLLRARFCTGPVQGDYVVRFS